MKKVLATILLVSYTIASSGASVGLHYCMGRFISLDINHSAKENCINCGMKTKAQKGCCDSKQIRAKIDHEQKITNNNISFPNYQISLAEEFPFYQVFLACSDQVANPLIHGPPFLSSIPTYLANCNFRI